MYLRSCLFATTALLAAGDWPRTVPEATSHTRTSTVADVQTYMTALAKRCPELKPYHPKGAPLAAEGGTPLLAWRLPATGKEPLRVYLNGNIHAGEVEGKEAIQQLVRELLQGTYPELRRTVDFVFMPTYNADGTDALDPAIRKHQPNPEGGVGRRENLLGLDLNRDLMKASAASTRFFLAMERDFDPHLVLDLHTTNGSYHTFSLTHAPATVAGGDPELMAFNRRMLREVQAKLKSEGLPTFDYGDFGGGEPARNGGTPTSWESFDPRPRYLANYPALRHRLGILSEAFVYKTYPERIEITRRFVLGCLHWAAARPADVKAQIGRAETTWTAAWAKGRPTLPLKADPAETEKAAIEAFIPLRDAQNRVIGEKGRQSFTIPIMTSILPKAFVPAPDGYLVDGAHAADVRVLLETHGIRVLPGTARPKGVPVMHFHESARELAKDAYQGVFGLTLSGTFKAEPVPSQRVTMPWRPQDLDRALYVPLNQPQGRLAFYLLDPRSDDGLVHWGVFHSSLVRGRGMWGEPPRFPILAVGDLPATVPAAPAQLPTMPKAE